MKPVSANLYEILGVSKNASQDDIRDAYYLLAKVHHPNSGVTTESEDVDFDAIIRSATILRDPQRRALYDSGAIDEFGKITDAAALRNRQTSKKRRLAAMAFGASVGVAAVFIVFSSLIRQDRNTNSDREGHTISVNQPVASNSPFREPNVGVPNAPPPPMTKPVNTPTRYNPQGEERTENAGAGPQTQINPGTRQDSTADSARSYLPPSGQAGETGSVDASDAAVSGLAQNNQGQIKDRKISDRLRTNRSRIASNAQGELPPAAAQFRIRRVGTMKQTAACLACLVQSGVDCVSACR